MKQIDFGSPHVGRNIARTALPVLIAQLVQLAYNIVDRIYIGRIEGEGTKALGAVGLVFPVIIIITGLTNLFGLGGAPLYSIALGQKNEKKAAQMLNTVFRLLVITGIAMTVLLEVLAVPVLHLFGAKEDMLAISLSYLRIYTVGTLFTMVASGMNPFINAQGFPRIGMMTVLLGAVSNLLLDPVFIFTFRLGVQGAAIATVLSQALSFLFVLRFFTGKQTLAKIRLFPQAKDKASYLPYASDIIGLGIPSFIMQATNALVQAASNQALFSHGGTLFVSVMTVVSSVRNILDAPTFSISDGTAPVISYNYGAGQHAHIRRAIWIMTVASVFYTLIVWGFIELRPEWLARVFTKDTELIEPAGRALRLYFRAFVFQALQYSGQATFKAMGFKKQAIFFSVFRKAVLVFPLIFLLSGPFGLGTDGVFLAEPVSNVIGGLACFVTMCFTVRGVLKEEQIS